MTRHILAVIRSSTTLVLRRTSSMQGHLVTVKPGTFVVRGWHLWIVPAAISACKLQQWGNIRDFNVYFLKLFLGLYLPGHHNAEGYVTAPIPKSHPPSCLAPRLMLFRPNEHCGTLILAVTELIKISNISGDDRESSSLFQHICSNAELQRWDAARELYWLRFEVLNIENVRLGESST